MKKRLLTLIAVLSLLAVFTAIRVMAAPKDEKETKVPEWKCEEVNDPSAPVVYFTKDISPEGLVRAYKALGWTPQGKVGVKISTGESAKTNHLRPAFIKDLVQMVNGTIVECNTAYGGSRASNALHHQVVKDRGYLDIAKFDLLDEEGYMTLPVNRKVLKEDYVGSHFKNYGSYLVLSHFKGHLMGGFGGALKNISIGIASTLGKLNIHSAGTSLDQEYVWSHLPAQDDFLESMADACDAVISYVGAKNMAYINVANRLSVDCDCDSNPAEPEMGDLGIFASLDPVALDQACYDAVMNSDDPGKDALIERMQSRHAIHTVETAEEHGLGVREYELICLD